MHKKILSLVLALILCMGLAAPAFAATISDTAGVNLTAGERKIYKAMEQVVLDIDAGRRTSTEVTIQFADRELGWSARELGFSTIPNDFFVEPVSQKLNGSLNRIYTCLEYNYPYELFFSYAYSWSYNFQWRNTGNELWLNGLTCALIVSPDYQGGSTTSVSPAAIAQVATAKAAAQAIVRENEGKSNYDKLMAYREAISGLTDYNYERNSTFGTDAYVYGYQCQAATVFDGDPNTKAVCEGYSKAFKYLCDLSDFDGDVYCYLVEGYFSEGTTSGAHMWNVVRMEDGNYYYTDVTLYDTSGPGAKVPLLAYANEDWADYDYRLVRYTYRDDQYGNHYGLFTNGWLPISQTPYEPGHAVTTPPPVPTDRFTDVKVGDFYYDAVQWAVGKNITSGTSSTTFSPGQTCTRGQIVTFLYRDKK